MIRLWLVATLVLLVPFGVGQGKPGKLKDLKHKLKAVRARQSSVRKELANTKHKVRVVATDIATVDHKLDQIETSLTTTSNKLADQRQEQARLKVMLQVETKKLGDKKEQVRTRMRRMYIQGDASLASAIGGATSLGDIASRKYLIERIATRDRELFEEVANLQKSVASRKRRQDELVLEIGRSLSAQKSQQADLKETRESKHELLGQLKDRQQDLEQMVREFDNEEASIAARIAAYNAGPGRNSGLTRPSGRLLMPVHGHLASNFGMRFHPILHRMRMHKGVDIGAPSGTPIHCAADGIVIAATYMRGYGNCLLVDHGGNVATLYGHCSRLLARQGEHVKRGQTIALVGSTGLSTGPHLHFEVHVGSKPVNPLGWL